VAAGNPKGIASADDLCGQTVAVQKGTVQAEFLLGTADAPGGKDKECKDAGKDGITVLRIPDLEPVAKLAVGMSINEVWISGDGRTVYATDEGRGLVVIGPDGSPIRVELNDTAGFIASERG